jgi:predicted RNA-binding Zn-ribbon protein involved in translation (DUF1610 family)
VKNRQPKILIYDIECTYVVTKEKRWGLWDDRPISREIVQDWYILCFAYKWLGDKKVKTVALPDFPMTYRKDKTNDKKVVEVLHELFSEADIVVAHNGNSFDQKKVQARMQIHHLPPPIPYAQIDTKLEAKRSGAHTSNKLSDLCKSLELQHKLDAGGMRTWEGCMSGDKKSWKHMLKYNKGDIDSLEALYLELRPWMKTHPAINVLSEKPAACPKCGGENMRRGMKYRATNTNLYQYFRCADCGGAAKRRIPEPKQAMEKMEYTNG